MAKIRTLKGEFFRSESVSHAGLLAKVLAAGLVCAVADDDGRFKASPSYIRGEVFTHDPISSSEVEEALNRLEAAGFIGLYYSGATRFGVLLGWNPHQKVPPSRYQPSRFPAPLISKKRKHMPAPAQADSRQLAFGIGREGKGVEGKGTTDISDSAPPEPERSVDQQHSNGSEPDQVRAVFLAWISSTGKTGRTQLDPKRRRIIAQALKAYSAGDLIAAVRGWKASPHHAGENATRTVYNDLELLLRDAKHIEMFRDLEQKAGEAREARVAAAAFQPEVVSPPSPEQQARARQQAADLREKTAALASRRRL